MVDNFSAMSEKMRALNSRSDLLWNIFVRNDTKLITKNSFTDAKNNFV